MSRDQSNKNYLLQEIITKENAKTIRNHQDIRPHQITTTNIPSGKNKQDQIPGQPFVSGETRLTIVTRLTRFNLVSLG